MVIPINLSFIDDNGLKIAKDELLILNKKKQNFKFSGFKKNQFQFT